MGSLLMRFGPAIAVRAGLLAAGTCGGLRAHLLCVVIKSIFRLSALQVSAGATCAPAELAPPLAWPIPLALLVRATAP